MKIMKYLSIVNCFLDVLILLLPTIAFAQETVFINAGETAVFTEFNYFDTRFDKDIALPPPETTGAEADLNYASAYITAQPGTGGRQYAETGVLFSIDPGTYSPATVETWPLAVTLEFEYELGVDYDDAQGSASAGIMIPDIIDGNYDEIGNGSPSERLTNNVSERFTTWNDGSDILAGNFMGDFYLPLRVGALSYARSPYWSTLEAHADARAMLVSITVEFIGGDSSTTTTSKSSTTTTTVKGTTTTTTAGNASTTTTTAGSASSTTTSVREAFKIEFVGTPVAGTAPLTVNFTPAANRKVVDGYWDFGDGEFSYEMRPVHTYVFPGQYTVRVVAYDANGNEAVAEKKNYITVSAATLQADFKHTPQVGEPPLEVSFFDRSTGEVVAWRWDFGDGAFSDEQHPAHTYEEEGNYQVSLEVMDIYGQVDFIEIVDAVHVEGNPLEASLAAEPLSGSAPLTVKFSDTSSGDAAAWLWHFGDGAISDEQNPEHTYEFPGIYSVGLMLEDVRGRGSIAVEDGLITVSPREGGFLLSGRITGTELEGFEVIIAGEVKRFAETDNESRYLFEGLSAGTYRVIPYKNGIAFNPPSRLVTIESGDMTGVDFAVTGDAPVILGAFAAPEEVPDDGDTPVVLVVQVEGSGVQSVVCNLTPIGGSASTAMYDDGTNGDEVAADGIYTLETTVSVDTDPGGKNIPVQVTNIAGKKVFNRIFLLVKNSFRESIAGGGSSKRGVDNDIEGQTLVVNVSLDNETSTAGGRMTAAADGSVLLQMLLPDGESYFDSPLSLTTKLKEFTIENASQGTWNAEVENKSSQSVQYRVDVSTAGTGTVFGQVVDAETGAPVDDVTITTTGGGSSPVDEGYFFLVHPAGIFTVKATPLTAAYGSGSESVSISAGGTSDVTLALLPRDGGTTDPDNGTDNASACFLKKIIDRWKDNRGDRPWLRTLRAFRDQTLARTAAGRRCIDLYYRFSPEVLGIVSRDASLRDDMLRLAALFGRQVQAGQPRPTDAVLRLFRACAAKVQKQAGPDLRNALGQFLNKLETTLATVLKKSA